MPSLTHFTQAVEGDTPSLSIDQKEAERIVKEALRFFGVSKAVRVHIITNEELRKKFPSLDENVQAMVHFNPEHSDCDIFLTELAKDVRHALFHEVTHLVFAELQSAISALERTMEKLVDYFAYIAIRSKGGGRRGSKRRQARPDP
jgi:hypothetical protein